MIAFSRNEKKIIVIVVFALWFLGVYFPFIYFSCDSIPQPSASNTNKVLSKQSTDLDWTKNGGKFISVQEAGKLMGHAKTSKTLPASLVSKDNLEKMMATNDFKALLILAGHDGTNECLIFFPVNDKGIITDENFILERSGECPPICQ